MTSSEEPYQIAIWITSILTFLAVAVFLWFFARCKDKNYGVYMILILSLIDLSWPIINIFELTDDLSSTTINTLTALDFAIYEFGLCWSTALAVLVSLVITQKRSINPLKFSILAFFASFTMAIMAAILIITGAFGIFTSTLSPGVYRAEYPKMGFLDKIAYFAIFNILCKVVPITITFLCYYKTYYALSSLSLSITSRSNSRPTRVLCYCLIQFICFLPGIAQDIFNIASGSDFPSTLEFIAAVLHRSWVFLNLLAYWFLRPPSKSDSSFKEGFDEISLTPTVRSMVW